MSVYRNGQVDFASVNGRPGSFKVILVTCFWTNLLGVPRQLKVARFLTILRGIIVPHSLRGHEVRCGPYFPRLNFQAGRGQDMGVSR
jgi:hypothetical protein